MGGGGVLNCLLLPHSCDHCPRIPFEAERDGVGVFILVLLVLFVLLVVLFALMLKEVVSMLVLEVLGVEVTAKHRSVPTHGRRSVFT